MFGDIKTNLVESFNLIMSNFKRFILLLILISNISAIDLELITKNLSKPVHLCSPFNNQDELYIVEQGGKIIKIDKNKKVTVFLDIQNQVKKPTFPGDERGLLGMAFDPNYITSKSFFINYIDKNENTTISKMKYSIDTNSFQEKILIQVKQPYSNHNGGHLEFGNDGYLYIAFGDGESSGDPENNAQSLSNFFGKIEFSTAALRGWTHPKRFTAKICSFGCAEQPPIIFISLNCEKNVTHKCPTYSNLTL